jgi:hypothetical protein
MKAKELMIGDWVYDTVLKCNTQVEMLSLSGIRGDCHDNIWNENTFEPIPLTPEILEKNGFVANKHVYTYPYYEYEVKESKVKVGVAFPQGNRTSYKEPWVYIDSERVFVEHLPCVFVHQLQHALKLCCIEKEIEL